jgi:glycosyltransferase involved in cell wall biosynthesis
MTKRIGFVIEQALGHVAYGMGLREVLGKRSDLECVWLDVPFGPGGFGRIPLVGRNWTLRGSLRARSALTRASQQGTLDALLIHTQTIGLFSAKHMARVPTLLSLDATPRNYDELAGPYGDRVHPGPVEDAKLWAHRSVMRHVRHFTAWSHWAKASLVRDYGVASDSITVIHPGAVLSKFPAPETRPPRQTGPLRVLFVGGDFARKGGTLLLDAWRSELKGSVELHLVTTADITPEPGLHVHHGVTPYSDELLRIYASVDVFVLPTRATGTSRNSGMALRRSHTWNPSSSGMRTSSRTRSGGFSRAERRAAMPSATSTTSRPLLRSL